MKRRTRRDAVTFRLSNANRVFPLEIARRNGRHQVLITGGAGFIGTNLADRLLSAGQRTLIFDNLSRSGSEANLAWLSARHGARLEFERGDVRNPDAIARAVRHAIVVFHFAAQVAVTDSLTDPQHDFDVNARGTLQLLEAIRQLWNPPAILFTSTNKVYGALPDLDLFSTVRRYLPKDRCVAKVGVNESRGLDFHSPYGCSKGAADQYVLDYARNFKVPAIVFRMSCVYGPYQNGTEDQGWVAHFLMRANDRAPIRIYGDGKQVRDLLFIEDLLDAFGLALGNVANTAGHVFNVGGGVQNAVSLLELLDLIRGMTGERCRTDFGPWRSGDQRYYVSDTRKFKSFTGWSPRVGVQEGLEILQDWLLARKECELPPAAAIDERQPLLRGAAAAGN